MYILQISFLYDPSIQSDHDILNGSVFNWLLASLAEFGYISRVHPLLFLEVEGGVVVTCRTPEKDAYQKWFDNQHVDKFAFERLVSAGVTVKFDCLGQDFEAPKLCKCEQRDFYFLRGSDFTPIYCGNCAGFIPLYWLPPTYDMGNSYYNLNAWQKQDLALTTLEFYPDMNIKYHLGNPDSPHTKEALELCKQISESTKIPCYFILESLEYLDEDQDKNNLCPKCQQAWQLEKPILDDYYFKCDTCFLIWDKIPDL